MGHHAGGDGVLAVFTVKGLHGSYLAVAWEAITFIYHSKGAVVPAPDERLACEVGRLNHFDPIAIRVLDERQVVHAPVLQALLERYT